VNSWIIFSIIVFSSIFIIDITFADNSTPSEQSENSFPPSSLTATAISPTEIRLSWFPPTSTFGQTITGYVIQREIINDVYDEIETVGSGTTTYTVSNLQTGKTYTYIVKAEFSVGTSPRSNAASATPTWDSVDLSPEPPKEAPEELEIKLLGRLSIDEGNRLAFIVGIIDTSLDNVRFSLASNAPSGASIDSSSGSFTWPPSQTQSGTYTFDVIAKTSSLEDRESITITVNDIPDTKPEPSKEEEYLDNGCPVGNPYLWSDGLCHDSLEPFAILAPFVDPSKDPQHYVDRYENEPEYQEWFDSNFPEYDSIYEAVGLDTSAQPPKKPEPEPVGMGSYENERYDFFFNIPMDWRYNEDLIIEEESFQVIMFPYEFTNKAIQESGEEVGFAELLTGLPFVISSPLIYVQFENISQENVPQLNERTLKEYALEKIRLVDPNARIINSNVETDSWGWTVSIEYVFPLKTEFGPALPYHAEDTTYFFKDRESYIVGYGTVEENYGPYYSVYENVLDTIVIKGVVVPEFQEIAVVILASSIVMIVIFTRKLNFPVLNKL